jgi:hypothetical protein
MCLETFVKTQQKEKITPVSERLADDFCLVIVKIVWHDIECSRCMSLSQTRILQHCSDPFKKSLRSLPACLPRKSTILFPIEPEDPDPARITGEFMLGSDK